MARWSLLLALGMRLAFGFGLLHLAGLFFRARLRGLGVLLDVVRLQVFLGALVVLARALVAALAHLLATARGLAGLEVGGPGLLLLAVAVAIRLLLQDAWRLG